MSVTIKEIAQRTGLSVPTVGNVLGRSAERYSRKPAAGSSRRPRTLGYRPNSSARAMRRGRIGCAALVLSRSQQQTHSYIPGGLLDGLDDELALHNMHLTVSRLSDEELVERRLRPQGAPRAHGRRDDRELHARHPARDARADPRPPHAGGVAQRQAGRGLRLPRRLRRGAQRDAVAAAAGAPADRAGSPASRRLDATGYFADNSRRCTTARSTAPPATPPRCSARG